MAQNRDLLHTVIGLSHVLVLVLVPLLAPSKGSRYHHNAVPFSKEMFFFLIRFSRQQRDFLLQTTWILSLCSSLHQTFLISSLQGSFCLGLSSSSDTSFWYHHGVSQNSIRFHHKDHERYIYSSYCSDCYWSGSLGREFSGGGIADASIFVITSRARHPLIMLFYPRWLQILPRSYEKSCLTSMWKQSRKILTVLNVLHTSVPRWMALPINEELLDMAKFLWQAADPLLPVSKRVDCH